MESAARIRRFRRFFPPVWLVLLAAVVLRPSGSVAVCVSYEDYLRWQGRVGIAGNVSDVDLSGDRAYVATHLGVTALDLSDPVRPHKLGDVATSSPVSGIAGEGDYAYFFDRPLGPTLSSLYVLDASPPGAPAIVASLGLAGDARDVAASGSLVCVVRPGEVCLDIIDVASPTLPVVVGSVPMPVEPRCVAVDVTHAYVGLTDGLAVVDVSDPESPYVAGSSLGWSYAFDVDVADGYAFVVTGSEGVRVLDVSDPTAPQIVGSLDTIRGGVDVAVSGSTAFTVDSWEGLRLVDVSDPFSPRSVGSFPVAEYSVRRVAVREGHVYIADNTRDLDVLAYEIPESPPVLVGSAGIPGEATAVAASGDVACLGASGLQIVDASNASAPEVVGQVEVATVVNDIAMAGSRAYVATSTQIQVIDLADPASPVVSGVMTSTGRKIRVAVAEPWAYVLNYHRIPGQWFVETYDVSDPAAISLVGSAEVEGATDLAVDGTWAYVNDWRYGNGLQVVDLSNPAAPFVAATLPLPHGTFTVAVAGGVACLTGPDSLFAVDVTDPTAPVYLGAAAAPAQASAVVRSGSYAYVAVDAWGVHLFDVSGAPPELVGSYHTAGPAVDIATSGGRIHVAGSDPTLSTLEILEPPCDAAVGAPPFGFAPGIAVGPVWPQPSLGRQRVQLTLPEAMHLRVRVHDVRGALVRTLLDRRLREGSVTLQWDGRDDGGRAVAAGVYFLRGDGGATFARKVVRLR